MDSTGSARSDSSVLTIALWRQGNRPDRTRSAPQRTIGFAQSRASAAVVRGIAFALARHASGDGLRTIRVAGGGPVRFVGDAELRPPA